MQPPRADLSCIMYTLNLTNLTQGTTLDRKKIRCWTNRDSSVFVWLHLDQYDWIWWQGSGFAVSAINRVCRYTPFTGDYRIYGSYCDCVQFIDWNCGWRFIKLIISHSWFNHLIKHAFLSSSYRFREINTNQ